MKYLLLCLFALSAFAMDPNLLNNLRAEVHRIASDVPGNAGSFITGISGSGRRADAVTNMGGVEATARNWGLPEHAVQRFKSAMFAAATAFQTFQVTIPARVEDATSMATMDEIVGVARNNGGNIQMAFAWATCRGRLIGQFDTIEYKKCKRILFVKKCNKKQANVPRGFTADEINLITRALRGTAYQELLRQSSFFKRRAVKPHMTIPAVGAGIVPLLNWRPKIDEPEPEFTEFPYEEMSYSILGVEGADSEETEEAVNMNTDPNGNISDWVNRWNNEDDMDVARPTNVLRASLPAHFFNRRAMTRDGLGLVRQAIADTIANKLPQLKQQVQSSSTSEIIQRLTGRGFSSFKQSTNVQQVNGVKHEYFDLFLDHLMSQLGVPSQFVPDVRSTLAAIEFAETNTWFFFSAVFSMQRGAAVKSISVLSRHNQADDTFDWFVADISAEFQLAPDVLVISVSKSYLGGAFGGSTQKIKLVPRGIRSEDLEAIFAFFDIVTFERFGEILNILGKRRAITSVQAGFADAISGMASSFSSIIGVIQSLKSETKSEIVNQFMGSGNGFSKLKQNCMVQRLTGMLPDYLPAFSNRLISRLKIPAARQADFVNTLADIPFFDSQQIMAYDFVFDINEGGSCKYVSLLIEKRPDEKINWLIADFVANFNLAPNVFVVRKAKSIAGIWSTSKDTFKIVPRGITDADVEFVFKWMQLISFKRFADLLNIAAPDPGNMGL